MNLILGDALDKLKELPDNSIDALITSPPYYGLRNYHTEPVIWGGDENCQHQWGEFMAPSVGVNTNYKTCPSLEWGSRRLTSTVAQIPGNQALGQFCSLCGAWKGELGAEPTVQLYISHLLEIFAEVKRVLKKTGTFWLNVGDTYNAKSKYAVPERLALGLMDIGLIYRNDIIWHKPSCLPSSARDRFTNDFEHLYFFVKSESYYFEQQFEPYSDVYLNDKRHDMDVIPNYGTKYPDDIEGGTKTRDNIFKSGIKEGRNKRAVWAINPARTKLAHFATFPEELIETPIKAGCPMGGVVMDCFAGTGTVAAVAHKLGRDYLMIERSEEYFKMMKERLDVLTSQTKLFEGE